ncbi:hypothetical protein KP509_02G052200 [Ceratopteris richardii]|uniref:RRM domain-containing protein n=3 Tax=Ceratopteris richardii TaxID=49495 RepID=A0A8T2V9E0_CERRI|nr:hypothetical protein KP509_02G052200 [Ceratopteris richardii]KAH7443821.1 hypothetical protein KP509_02G052200 [Ceratopteris richardii]
MAGTGGLVGASALDEELRNSNVVRLRGLPFKATESEIKEFFEGLELGPDGIVICVNFQGRSTGQAYVQFASLEIAEKALGWNRKHMGNRYIEVFKGHPSDMQGALKMVGRGSSSSIDNGNMMSTGFPGISGSTDMNYVGVVRMRGLPYSCTEADITVFFKGMSIASNGIFLCMNGDGRPTGEAFVEFVDEETASRAMQLHREQMGSRYVELFRSSKGEMASAGKQQMYGSSSRSGGFNGFGQGAGTMAAPSLPRWGMLNFAAAMGLSGFFQGIGKDPSENTCVKMRGLPFNAEMKDIVNFFDGYKIAPNGILIVTGASDRPTGEAFVEFTTTDEAQRAMERHKQNMGSRYIELFRATKSECLQALWGLPGAGMMDPVFQLLFLQQQAAMGALSMGGYLGRHTAGPWNDFSNANSMANNIYQGMGRHSSLRGVAAFSHLGDFQAGRQNPPS